MIQFGFSALIYIFIFLVVASLLAIWGKPFVIVQQQTKAVIERFGKFSRILGPGLHIIIPFVEQVCVRQSLRVRQLDVDGLTKTQDNVFMGVQVAVQYRVAPDDESVRSSAYELENHETQMRSFVLDVLRAEIPKRTLDQAFSDKEALSQSIFNDLSASLKSYGFEIIRTPITDISPAQEVIDAMNRINAEERNKAAQAHKAEANKILIVKEAEARAKSKALQGQGIGDMRENVLLKLHSSVQKLGELGLSPREAIAISLAVQHIEMQESLAKDAKGTIVFQNLKGGEGFNIMGDIMGALATASEPQDIIRETRVGSIALSEELEPTSTSKE